MINVVIIIIAIVPCHCHHHDPRHTRLSLLVFSATAAVFSVPDLLVWESSSFSDWALVMDHDHLCGVNFITTNHLSLMDIFSDTATLLRVFLEPDMTV